MRILSIAVAAGLLLGQGALWSSVQAECGKSGCETSQSKCSSNKSECSSKSKSECSSKSKSKSECSSKSKSECSQKAKASDDKSGKYDCKWGKDKKANARIESPTPDQALKMLQVGNKRYLKGETKFPRVDPARRKRTAKKGQKPIASVLGCADARVPVEMLFDSAFGDLFVVRVAGNVCDTSQLASIEFGTLYLDTPLIVVLGHSKCGAVQAAIGGGQDLKGKLPKLMKKIRPAVKTTKKNNPDLKDDKLETAAIEENIRLTMKNILKSKNIKKAVDEGKIKIVGAVRELKTGEVRWLDM